LGETLVYYRSIYCAGTTFGTPTGIRAYVEKALIPGYELCENMDYSGGIDQGIHNVFLHTQTKEHMSFLMERAKIGGPFADSGPTVSKDPIMKRPIDLLKALEGVQKTILVREAPTEDGYVCFFYAD
jgi:hypothetical protein